MAFAGQPTFWNIRFSCWCFLQANVVKEAAWTISNITAGPPEQIQAVIDNHCLPALIEILAHGEFKSKKESAWAITNLTSGNDAQLFLCTVGCTGSKTFQVFPYSIQYE